MVEDNERNNALFPERVGDSLRAARIKANFDLADIATRTRVPIRHLEAIELGHYSDLPSPTYAIGFVKAYAKAIGEDGDELARVLRDEIGQRQPEQRGESINFEDADPARVPTHKLAWTALLILGLVLVGYGTFRYMAMQIPPAEPAEVEVAVEAPASEPTAPSLPNPSGQVVLTAKELVWLRIYDSADKVLHEKEMVAGEAYSVPADANNPMIRTGRPDLITVTLDGKEIAPLGPAERTIKDVGISAAALAARTPVAAPLDSTQPVPTSQP